MSAGLGVDAHRVAVAALEPCGEFRRDLRGLVRVEGHVGLLHRREHLRCPPRVDGILDVGVLKDEIECRLRSGIEVRRGGIAPEQPCSHDGHSLAVATGQCFVDLIGPFLRRRIQHAAARGRLGTHFVLTKQSDHPGGTKLSRAAPVGETEPIDHRVKAVVRARCRILALAVRQGVALEIRARLGLHRVRDCISRHGRLRTARPTGGQHAGQHHDRCQR